MYVETGCVFTHNGQKFEASQKDGLKRNQTSEW